MRPLDSYMILLLDGTELTEYKHEKDILSMTDDVTISVAILNISAGRRDNLREWAFSGVIYDHPNSYSILVIINYFIWFQL
jgi:hypothetical protein